MSTISVADSTFKQFIRWGIYPASWLFLVGMVVAANTGQIAPRNAWLMFVVSLVFIYIVLERLVPYETRWSMTTQSFLNDLKYLVANGATLGAFTTLLGLFAISTAGQVNGLASDWPFAIQMAAILLIFEAGQYSLHRFEHEGRGALGRFMWRVHAAHHLPEKVYIVMHVAGHPINAMLVQGVIMIVPIWLMGYSEMVVVTFLMLNSMHGLISHFNVDARIGYANYLFIGPELHRYHHSANPSEGKNYGATLSVYDLLFRTFVYKPGVAPSRLGVFTPRKYPLYGQFSQVLRLPFRASE